MANPDLHNNFDHQLAISKELSDFSYEMVAGDLHAKEGSEFTRKHYVFFGLIDKCFVSHDAIRLLAEKGFVDDAWAVVRTVVEATINATYVMFVGGDEAAENYTEFHKYKMWKEFKDMESVDPELARKLPAERVSAMQRDFESVDARYEKNRNGDWIGINLFARAKAIDAAVGKEFTSMRFLVNSPWRQASDYVHGSSKSIASRFLELEGGVIRIHRKITKEEQGRVLDTQNYVMFGLLAVLDVHLGTKHKEHYLELQARWLG